MKLFSKLFLLLFGLSALNISAIVNAQIDEPVHQTEDYALFVTIKIKPEKVVEYKRVLLPYLEKVRSDVGLLTYKMHQSADDPTNFELYAHFTSKEAHESHLNQQHTKDYLAIAKSLFLDGYPIRRKVFQLR